MAQNDDHSWTEFLTGLKRPETQADPKNEQMFPVTVALLEAGLNIIRRHLDSKQPVEYFMPLISRADVLREAERLKEHGSCHNGLKVGYSAFNDRWHNMKNYRSDLVVYALYSREFHKLLQSSARRVIEGLGEVKSGRRRASDLITNVCTRDFKLRRRVWRYIVFQLQITLVTAYKQNAARARTVFYERQRAVWVATLAEAFEQLQIELRPRKCIEKLYDKISNYADVMILRTADGEDDSRYSDEEILAEFIDGVMDMIHSAIDVDFDARGMSVVEVIDMIPRRAVLGFVAPTEPDEQ